MKFRSKILVSILVSLFLICGLRAEIFIQNPRVGIVISNTSFQHRWGVTQMSAHGWAAVLNLAGIPYDCLFLSDLPKKNLSRYSALVIGQCGYVEDELYDNLIPALQPYLDNGGSLVVDGPFAVNNADAKERDHTAMDNLLGIENAGFHGDSEFRIKVSGIDHFATRMLEQNQYVTQHLANGLNILKFAEGGQELLETTDEVDSYPFLSVKETRKNRIALVSDFSTWAGAPSFFRNAQPQVFYANRLFDILPRVIQWAVYGDLRSAFPVPQVSNANLTAIIRLDADASGNLDAQIKTINYLVDLAKATGVVPVYAWVSSGAAKAGWQDLAPLGKMIEDVGGEIGTHSKFHRINREMTPERWEVELDEAIEEIEFNMSDYGYDIGDVRFFINPGNTIHMDDYDEVARRFTLYMTHGFEQDMPLGFGNLTWYADENPNFVVLENNPSPDYQWFYDPSWSYTTQQITAYEEAIFDHMFQNISRGVIFNEMWHDYSITSQPQSGKERIMNENNIAMYDAIRAKFATNDIYAPQPEDLGNKLRAMAQWNYEWKSGSSKIEFTLDLSDVLLDTVSHFTGGMGIRINNTHDFIRRVTINGAEHRAFTERVVILPNLKKDKNRIEIELAPTPSQAPRLTYISKRMPFIKESNNEIELKILTKSKGRFKFYAGEGYALLNADWFEWNRNGDNILEGYVTSDRNMKLVKTGAGKVNIRRATLPITQVEASKGSVHLNLKNNANAERTVWFGMPEEPESILVNGKKLTFSRNGDVYMVTIPEFESQAELIIELLKGDKK
ncbi:MAG: hypothetical protein K9N46_08815 [Candidatus Marinimicrobia bacterium]|nr:hypothetical protein [Candidatus Neomarinimicrobiota bacterium]MCF7830208.1 hypothetical protein [Candidatus Neomarinimicrobiota bacterium]MCF7880825.1 hypothetical protein [Candidatus Neomarinimicrobiota bacterium]